MPVAATNRADAKRVLVTGGTGFVGANLVRRLLGEGHEVGVLVKTETDTWRLADVTAQLRWINVDLDGAAGLEEALADFKPHIFLKRGIVLLKIS